MHANVLAGECGEVSHAVPCHEVVGYNSVEHGNCHLGALKIKRNMQPCGPVHRHGNKTSGIDSAGDMDKAYILLMAEISGSVLHWKEKGRIASDGCIVDACAGQVMVRDDVEVPEIEPRGAKEAAPIMRQAINNRAAVQLGAHCLKNEACIDSESFECALGYLKRVCTLRAGILGSTLG